MGRRVKEGEEEEKRMRREREERLNVELPV